MIQFRQDQCIGCGRCVWDCFPGALDMTSGKAVLSRKENCIGCGHCIAICPRAAVWDDSLDMAEAVPVRQEVSPETLLDLMRSRRSCRHFRSDPIPVETVQTLLDAARACPTAKNLQGTRYIAVAESIPSLLDAALESLGQVGMLQKRTATAPDELRRAENFIAWSEMRKQDKTFDPLFFHAPLLLLFVASPEGARDAAGAAAYTELMAASLGLGCLFSGYFTACAAGNPKIAEILGLSEGQQVVRCLVLGKPDVRFLRTAPRKPADIQWI